MELTRRDSSWNFTRSIIQDFIHCSICFAVKRKIGEVRSSIKDCCGRSSVCMNASPNIVLLRGDIVIAWVSDSDEDTTSLFFRAWFEAIDCRLFGVYQYFIDCIRLQWHQTSQAVEVTTDLLSCWLRSPQLFWSSKCHRVRVRALLVIKAFCVCLVSIVDWSPVHIKDKSTKTIVCRTTEKAREGKKEV